MLILGIAGGSEVGKSTTAEAIMDAVVARNDSMLVVCYEISELVSNVLEWVGISTDPKTDNVRETMKIIVEACMRHGDDVWMNTILRLCDADHCGEVDLLVISGIRRECEARWVQARGGRTLWIGPEYGFPQWVPALCWRDVPSPTLEETRPKWLEAVGKIADDLVVDLNDEVPTAEHVQ